MDANRLRFWMLAGNAPWEPMPTSESEYPVEWHEERYVWRLASAPRDNGPKDSDGHGQINDLNEIPGTMDRFGTYAFARKDTNTNTQKYFIEAGGVGSDRKTIAQGFDFSPTDIVAGYDDILYVAASDGIHLIDLRRRFLPTKVSPEGLEAWRLCALPDGGVLALGALTDQELQSVNGPCALVKLSGRPMDESHAEPPSDAFVPAEPNPNPPIITSVDLVALDEPDDAPFIPACPVAIASSPGGNVAVLFWRSARDAFIRLLNGSRLDKPIAIPGITRPTSFSWISENRIAFIVRAGAEGKPSVRVFKIDKTNRTASELGDYCPIPPTTKHFLHGTTFPAHYDPGNGKAPVPLHPVSLPSYWLHGTVEYADPIDSREPSTEWHRLYIEATIPARCGMRVFLAATNSTIRPTDDDFYEHRFGQLESDQLTTDIPRGTWIPTRSEIPFHDGLLHGAIEPHKKGLFTALVQRAGHQVRTLRGRYLWVRVELSGDGRATPELAALRVYASRFSYLNQYLPEFYREQLFGTDADELKSATAADFLERFLGIAEGILTPLEDRIANAFALTDPRKVPEESFEWLASFIGFTFDPIVPKERRRALLAAAPAIRKWHGTMRGLRIALDAVTNGAVSRGALVIVEDYKLRRTFSTILGANLDRDDDPLLPGLHESGNSYVGDTLFLSEDGKKEFLALFGAGIEKTQEESEIVARFFDELAHRVTILAHEGLDTVELGLLRRMAELEAPAHVRVSVTTATYPFMVAVASLVGVDTFMGPAEKPGSVRVGRSALGLRDLLTRPPSLDPRLQSGEERFG